VTIWDSTTGKELFSFKGHDGEVVSVAFSPDGQHLASGSVDRTVKIWDSATGKERLSLKGHAGEVYSVAFSPDGQRLASGSRDKTVKIWDSATGKELISLKGHAGWVTKVAFSPDGQWLASVNRHDSIHLWETIVPLTVQDRRAAHQLVADLFRQMGFRASVLEWLQALTGMNPTRRQEALTAAQTYPENPETFNNLAWNLVALPDRRMLDYRKAVRYSEAACLLEPKNGLYLTTLGMAYYRAGSFLKALETLQKSEKIHQAEAKVSHPADLAFLAMTQQRLGHAKEARAYLQQLREGMKDAGWAKNAEWQSFLREAETLLAKPITPGNK
jgi:tetratricopeptide (TPR) repeat protein